MMMAEMVIAALIGMDAFACPGMIGGIALEPSAMQPSTPRAERETQNALASTGT